VRCFCRLYFAKMSSAKTDGDLSRRSLKLKPTFDQRLPSMVCMLPTGQDTGLHATDIKMVRTHHIYIYIRMAKSQSHYAARS